jgi:hypothetical protein
VDSRGSLVVSAVRDLSVAAVNNAAVETEVHAVSVVVLAAIVAGVRRVEGRVAANAAENGAASNRWRTSTSRS